MSEIPSNNELTAAAFVSRPGKALSPLGDQPDIAGADLLGVPHPDPARASHEFNDYVFERRVERRQPDGTTESRRIDLYKRGCFILEAKQSRQRGGSKALPEDQADLFSPPRKVSP